MSAPSLVSELAASGEMDPTSHLFLLRAAKFKQALSPRELKQFGATTGQDVRNVLYLIQQDQDRTKELMDLTRIRSFLHGISKFEGLLSELLGVATCRDLLSYVWGPVQLLLKVINPAKLPIWLGSPILSPLVWRLDHHALLV
jgi:hypothetical protein